MLKSKLTIKMMLTAIILSNMIFFSSCNEDDNSVSSEEETVVLTYPVVGTNQTTAYNNMTSISTPSVGDDFYGQNVNYPGNEPSYVNNGDGTVTDMVTGLMWQQSFDHNGDGSIDVADKASYADIVAMADTVTTGGYSDWRLATIKEMYSLILFSGRDVSVETEVDADDVPFINTMFFDFAYGDTENGERIIDVQCATTAMYVSTEAGQLLFGVNFADGRIKGYGLEMMGAPKQFNYLFVRGAEDYGINDFVDNVDNTVSDNATGLMWSQTDSEEGMYWEEALVYAEASELAGYDDWRLPSAKELQSIVDYTRSPATTNSATIDPLFTCTSIINEAGVEDYPWYWSGTTHASSSDVNEGGWGAYVAFGRCMGYMAEETDLPIDEDLPIEGDLPPEGEEPVDGDLPPADGELPPPVDDVETGVKSWIDVHGAGAQRSDPKTGDPTEYSEGHGPQGDAVRILNYVRLVRNI